MYKLIMKIQFPYNGKIFEVETQTAVGVLEDHPEKRNEMLEMMYQHLRRQEQEFTGEIDNA